MDKSRYGSIEFSWKVLFGLNIFGLIAAVIVVVILLSLEEILTGDALLVLLVSVIGYCSLNVFLGIARDIMAIRNAVEKEHV